MMWKSLLFILIFLEHDLYYVGRLYETLDRVVTAIS